MGKRVLGSFDAAAAHLAHRISGLQRRSSATVMIGIGGPTAGGKSTLAQRFRSVLAEQGERACILEGDRFLVPQARRTEGTVFPDGVYEIERLKDAVKALNKGHPFRVPFYEKDRRVTGRVTVETAEVPPEIAKICRIRQAMSSSRLTVDTQTGDVLEAVVPEGEIWIFDSELALLYADLRACYAVSYGIRASRSVRRGHFLDAVARGERYPLLTRAEAARKIEGFWETDDALIEPTVDAADYVVALDA